MESSRTYSEDEGQSGGRTRLKIEGDRVGKDAREAAQRAVDDIGMGQSQVETLFLAGGVFCMEGMILIIAGIIARTLEAKWNTTLGHTTVLVTALFVGVTVGTILGGFASDAHGRRPVILTCYFGSTIVILLSALGWHWGWMALTNIALGFFFGYGVPAANTLISECCPTSQRSNLVCSAAILFAVGQLMAAWIVWIVSPYLEYETLAWRKMVLLSCILPAVMFPIAWFRMRESPMWQLAAGQQLKCLETLQFSARLNGITLHPDTVRVLERVDVPSPVAAPVQPPSPRTSASCGYWLGTPCRAGGVCAPGWGWALGERIRTGWEFYEKKVAVLFREQYRSTTIVMTWVCFCSNFCYYGMIYTLPETFVELLLMLEGKTNSMHLSPALSLMIASLFEIPGVLLAIILGLTVPRRWTLVIAFSVTSIAAVCLVSSSQEENPQHAFVLTSLAAFLGKLFIAAAFILVYLYLLEVYPTHIRATGLAFAMSLGRFGAFVIPFIAESLMLWTDSSFHVFVALAVVACAAALTCLFLPVETKDRPLHSGAETPLLRGDQKRGSKESSDTL